VDKEERVNQNKVLATACVLKWYIAPSSYPAEKAQSFFKRRTFQRAYWRTSNLARRHNTQSLHPPFSDPGRDLTTTPSCDPTIAACDVADKMAGMPICLRL
jgi:hypothetical protein